MSGGDRDGTSSLRRRQLLRGQHLGPKGTHEERNWRPGIEDLEDVLFGGLGIWRPIGPAPYDVQREQLLNGVGPNAGEVLDFAMSSSGGAGPTLYVATNGGVWKSATNGDFWVPITDMLPSLAIGAVAVDAFDPTIVYAGTRNLSDGSGIVPRAMGAWRSDDEGATWSPIDGGPDATVLGNGINRIVAPLPDIVLAACTDGLYLSVNGGTNFGANSPDFNDGKPIKVGNISDIAIDTDLQVTRPLGGTAPQSTTNSTILVNCSAHGFETDDEVLIVGSADPSALGTWTIDFVDSDHFALRTSSSTSTGGAQGFIVGQRHPKKLAIQNVAFSTGAPAVVITSPGHGLLTGDVVAVGEVPGVASATGSWVVRVRTIDDFELVGSKGKGAWTGGGTIEAPSHAIPLPITSATNVTDGIELEIPGHTLLDGDRVSVRDLPGVAVEASTGVIRLLTQPNRVVVRGLKMNVANHAGGTVIGPAASWNMVYFAVAGRTFDRTKVQSESGLFRFTLTSDNRVALSGDIAAIREIKGKYDHLVFAQTLLPRSRTLYLAAQATHPTTRFLNLFRSDDLGANWRSVMTPTLTKSLDTDGTATSDDALTLGVDPRSGERVFLGMRQLWISSDGGASWPTRPLDTGGGDLHASINTLAAAPSTGKLPHHHHAIAFVPPVFWPPASTPTPPIPVLFGTGGGISRSNDGGATFTHLNQGLSISSGMSLDMGRGATNQLVSATALADGGVVTTRDKAGYTWRQGISGDAGDIAVDLADPDIVYAFVDGRFVRSVNGGLDWIDPTEQAPVILRVHNFTAVQFDTLGHPFKQKAVVTVSEVRSADQLVNAVNGTRKITADDGPIFTLDGVNGNLLAPFDQVATATGKRFLRDLGIVRVSPASPIVIHTAVPHGVGASTFVHVEGVRSLPGANNTSANLMWAAEPVTDTSLRLVGSSAPSGADLEEHGGRVRIETGPGSTAIQFATNEKPIVVTAIDHGFVTGQTIDISGVRGNTNANGNGQQITVIDRCSFRLGVDGNGAFGAQPTVTGLTFGYGLPLSNGTERQRIVLVPKTDDQDKPIPSQKIFVSVRNTVYRSDNHGCTFVSVKTFDSDVTALAYRGINLWAGLAGKGGKAGTVHVAVGDGDTPWREEAPSTLFVPEVGVRGTISGIAVDPKKPTTVAIVASGYSDVPMQRGTHHCFVSKHDGFKDNLFNKSTWEEVKNFLPSDPTLPDLPVNSVVFVRQSGDSDLLAASDGGVLRATVLGWQRCGPNLPTISCQRLAADNSSTSEAAIVRVATHGRGVWELVIPPVQHLVVRGSFGFGERRKNRPATLPLILYNAGNQSLTINAVDVVGPEFAVPLPAMPLFISPGEHKRLDVVFTPTSDEFKTGVITVKSNDPERPALTFTATGFGVDAGIPRVSVRRRAIDFGNREAQSIPGVDVTFKINNTGTGDAEITRAELVAPVNAALQLTTTSAVPFPLNAGASEEVTLEFSPTTVGPVKGILRIESRPAGTTDPPKRIDIPITGTGTKPGVTVLASVMNALGLAREEAALA